MSDHSVKVLDPSTGEVESLPAEQAQQAYVSGKRQVVKGTTIPMVGRDGTVMDFPSDKIAGAIDGGWNFASKEHVLAHDAEHQKVQAFAEGAASPLSLGVSDLILQQAGVEGLKQRRDTTAGMAGQAAGLGTSLIIPGLGEGAAVEGAAGKGLASMALDAAMAPTMGAMAVGDAVEAGAAKALSSVITNEAAAKIAASGLGRAVEGAAYGAGGQLSEEALGNPDANAESLIAAAGGGALMGGLTGGVFGAGLRGLGEWRAGVAAEKAAARAKPMAASLEELEQGLRDTGVDVKAGNPLLNKFAKLIREDLPESVGGYSREDIQRVNTPRAQAWLREGKQVLDESGRDLRKVIDNMAAEQTEAGNAIYGKLRPEVLDKLIPQGAENASLKSVAADIANAKQHLLDLIENEAALGLGNGGGKRAVQNYLDAFDSAEARIFRKAGVSREYEEKIVQQDPLYNREDLVHGQRVEAHNMEAKVGQELPLSRSRTETTTRTRSLDDLADKYTIPAGVAREAFDAVESVKRLLAKPGRFGDDVAEAGQREVQKAFQNAYGVLREGLENTATWGEAGQVNKELNSAFHQRNDAWRELKRNLKFNGEEVDPSAISSYISKIDKLKGDRAAEALDQWHAANKSFATVAEKHFAGAGIGARSDKLLKEFGGVRANLEDKVGVFNALTRLTNRRNQVFGFGGGGGFAAGAIVGSLGFLPASAAGVIGQNIIDPGRAALLRANMAGTRDRVGAYIRAHSEGLVTGIKKALPSLPTTERTLSKATLAMLHSKSAEERHKAYEDRVVELQALSNPQVFGGHVAGQLEGYQDHAPNHASAMTNTAAAAIGLLNASLPAMRSGTGGDGGPFDLLHAKPRPHDRDILKFAQVDQAVQNPLVLFDYATKGYLGRHQIEAVEKVYPNLIQSVRTSITESAGRVKGRIPVARSRVLGQLLGGAMVPPAKLASMQAVHVPVEPPQPPSQSSMSAKPRASGMQTATDRLDSYPAAPSK